MQALVDNNAYAIMQRADMLLQNMQLMTWSTHSALVFQNTGREIYTLSFAAVCTTPEDYIHAV